MASQIEVRKWAEALIRIHLPPDWSFGFDYAKRRAGVCRYDTKRITVSKYLLETNSDDEIYQVLLHEISHAIAGKAAGHSKKWLNIARELGYDGDRLHRGPLADQTANWIGRCQAGHEHYRFRAPKGIHFCAKCSKKYTPEAKICWQRIA